MTGIERLRKLSEDMLSISLWVRLATGTEKDWDCYQGDGRTVNDELLSIADQIEQEARAPFSRVRVLAVVTKMERHVSGHEGMEDSPVARWARELREALGTTVSRQESDPVSVSAYDLLPEEDREAIAWVRDHGGLSHVKDILHDFRAVVEHIGVEWSESELHGLMDALDRRLMPEGMEWIKYDTGEPVPLGGEVTVIVHDEDGDFDRTLAIRSIKYKESGVLLEGTKNEMVILSHGERVRRPAVLAADGEPLEVGQTVWDADGMEFRVESFDSNGVWGAWKTDDGWIKAHPCPTLFTHQRPVLDADGNRIEPAMDVWWVCEGDRRGVHAERLHVDGIDDDGEVECSPYNGGTSVVLEPSELYVNKPVLDADGVPIKEGDTVWPKYPYEESDRQVESAEVVYVHRLGRIDIQAKYATGMSFRQQVDAKQLTHTKPEPRDSWERIEEDKGLNPFDYCKKVGHKLWTFDNAEEVKASDLVRRAKKLAGVDND